MNVTTYVPIVGVCVKTSEISKMCTRARAVVVPQLVERSPPTPEDPGWNPVISKFYEDNLLTVKRIKTKIKKNRSGMTHLEQMSLDLKFGL